MCCINIVYHSGFFPKYRHVYNLYIILTINDFLYGVSFIISSLFTGCEIYSYTISLRAIFVFSRKTTLEFLVRFGHFLLLVYLFGLF